LRKNVSFAATILLLLLPISVFSSTIQTSQSISQSSSRLTVAIQDDSSTSVQPIYLRLQSENQTNATLWESIPQNLTDHAATIEVNVLAVFVNSGASATGIYEDAVGNLWLTAAYTLKKGDNVSTLAWISRKTLAENTSIPNNISFPQNYPADVQPFLQPGNKIPSDDPRIRQVAESLSSENMIQTVENVLNFVNETQNYDREKVRTLMNGTLSTSSMLDFVNDPLQSLNTNLSFCYERALLATAILRAVGVPTRTFTNGDLKTWIQVWLPQTGWVDGEVLSIQPQPIPLFPRSMSVSVPRMIENSSGAVYPFTWFPETMMRVANLTLTTPEQFDINEYRTILCQPTETETFESDPTDFSFPLLFAPETVQAALTSNGSQLSFHISKGSENVSRELTIGVMNNIEFEDISVSFTPERQNHAMIALNNFSIQKSVPLEYTIGVPILIAVPIFFGVTYFWKRRRNKRRLHDRGNLISSEKS
jgi:Transglutaminase-like superfamily